MNIKKSVLIEENGDGINITKESVCYVVSELVNFAFEEFQKDYEQYKKLPVSIGKPRVDHIVNIILDLESLKNNLKETVDEDDLKSMLGMKIIF